MRIAETQAYWRQINSKRTKYFKLYARKWARFYNAQMKILREDKTAEIFKVEDVSKLFEEMYREVGLDFAKYGYAAVITKAESYLEDYWLNQMSEYALSKGVSSIKSISATGKEAASEIIRKLTAEAIEQGYSIDELARYIDDNLWDEWKIVSKYSAERIARTEIIAASNYGSDQGARSTGLPLVKTWLTAMDGRERDSHAALNNETVTINEKFSNGLMFPGDKTSGSTEEIINCRCSVFQRVLR